MKFRKIVTDAQTHRHTDTHRHTHRHTDTHTRTHTQANTHTHTHTTDDRDATTGGSNGTAEAAAGGAGLDANGRHQLE